MQAPLFAPIPVAQLTDELEMPAIAKRLKNTARKEWDCIIQRRALPGLNQDAADDLHNPYTSPKKASRSPAAPLKGQDSQSPSKNSATPGWHKRSPPKQKQVFLAESAQSTDGLAVSDSSGPRKVSAMRIPAGNEATALASPEAVIGKRTGFLGRIDRTNAFAKPEPLPLSKYQVQKNKDPDGLTRAIFAGKRIRAIGEANCAALRQELERVGAELVITKGADVDFYVVRLAGYGSLALGNVSH